MTKPAVCAISGSPRQRSFTHRMLDLCIEGMGDVNVSKFLVREIPVIFIHPPMRLLPRLRLFFLQPLPEILPHQRMRIYGAVFLLSPEYQPRLSQGFQGIIPIEI